MNLSESAPSEPISENDGFVEITEQFPGPAKRSRGRPRRGDAPVIDWARVEQLLVFGEPITDPATGAHSVRFPSLKELSKRFGVSPSRVWQYNERHQCIERRREAKYKVDKKTEEKIYKKIRPLILRIGNDVLGDALPKLVFNDIHPGETVESFRGVERHAAIGRGDRAGALPL